MKLLVSKDPMGQAISDHYRKSISEKLWVYSNISEKDEIPVEYLFRDHDEMPAIEQTALKHCKGKTLDIGAATGSHALWLQNNKQQITTLEISELACEIMQKRGIKSIINQDFFIYTAKQKYDTLLLLMNGIGIAGQISQLGSFFDKCSALLSPGGQILLDSSDLNYLYEEEDEKPTDNYYGEVKYVMNYGEIISDAFNWLFIDFETLKTEAKKHGFTCEKILNGSHYDYLARLTKQ